MQVFATRVAFPPIEMRPERDVVRAAVQTQSNTDKPSSLQRSPTRWSPAREGLMRTADGGIGVSRLEARRTARRDLIAVTDRLIAEFAGQVPAGTVMRYVGRAREQLLATGVRAGLAVAAEAMARARLRTLLSGHGSVG